VERPAADKTRTGALRLLRPRLDTEKHQAERTRLVIDALDMAI
jgi:hypothetical protein